MSFNPADIPGMKITVMGLGLNGGGYESVKYFASRGAVVTATDLRDADTLKPTIDRLSALPVRYVLGKHQISDFSDADIVIKNPAVKWDSPFLKAAARIETDISIFLQTNRRPLIAVTGSKGKSTTVSALHYALQSEYPDCDLGGNITVSPLKFADKETEDPVILELSSWQLGDLRNLEILTPQISLITNIMHDHMNYYDTFEDYIQDKKRIYYSQHDHQYTLCNFDDPVCRQFYNETRAKAVYFSGRPLQTDGFYIKNKTGFAKFGDTETEILPAEINMKGEHNRINLLTAAACAYLYGTDPEPIRTRLAGFSGIAHRMEFVGTVKGISFYNDSAATIPQATIEALNSFENPVHIICGGTDKECDFTGFSDALSRHYIYLLKGSATNIFIKDLKQRKIPFKGPFETLKKAFHSAVTLTQSKDTVILSPGATSFGMFLNEFDRGNQFKDLVREFGS